MDESFETFKSIPPESSKRTQVYKTLKLSDVVWACGNFRSGVTETFGAGVETFRAGLARGAMKVSVCRALGGGALLSKAVCRLTRKGSLLSLSLTRRRGIEGEGYSSYYKAPSQGSHHTVRRDGSLTYLLGNVGGPNILCGFPWANVRLRRQYAPSPLRSPASHNSIRGCATVSLESLSPIDTGQEGLVQRTR